MYLQKHSDAEISFLCIICDRDKIKEIEEILKTQKTFLTLVTFGIGTANSKILNYLGIGETEKAIFFCVLPKDSGLLISESLDQKLELINPGHGILFLTQTKYGCYHKPLIFANNENGDEKMESSYNLIMVISNRGYSEDVMDSARQAGATGGTLINARGCGAAGMEKFFGIVVTPEKEMIMIVASEDITEGIMSAVAEKNGPETDAAAISFVIPVTGVKGLDSQMTQLP